MPASKGKLRQKLMLLLITVASLPFLLVMSGVIIKLQDIQRNNAVLNEKQIAFHASREIAEFISLQFKELNIIGNIYSDFFDNPDIQKRFLERMLFSNDSFVEIVLVDSRGKETARINKLITILPEDLVDRPQEELLAIKEKGYWIGQIFWEKNRPFFIIGQKISGVHNILQGAIFAKIDARIMQEIVSSLSVVREKGRAYMVDKTGIVIAHPDISQVLAEKDFSSIPAVAALIQEKQSFYMGNAYRNELGQKVLGAGVPIEISLKDRPGELLNTSWFVIAEIPDFVALAAVREITFFTILILAAILFIAIFTAVFFSRTIVNPIEQLQAALQKLTSGNLEYRLSIKTNDEIENLANSFNQMAEELSKSKVALENEKNVLEIRVEARTKELKELSQGLDRQVEEKTKELRQRVDDLERFQKLTVGRELKMVELKEEIRRLQEKQ